MLNSSFNSHNKADYRQCVGLAGRQRTQTGNTNRWQLAPPPPGDLLGQSQVEKAARSRVCVHTPARSETLQQRRDDPPSQQPPPLHAVSPAGPRTSKNIQLLHTSANPEHQFYLLSQQLVKNAQPDAVLECLGSLWELHCPYLMKSETLAELYSAAVRQRHTLRQERAVSGGGDEYVSLRGKRLRLDGGMGTSRSFLTRPILLSLNINNLSITKEAFSLALSSMYRCEVSPAQWGEAMLCTATLLRLPKLKQRCVEEIISNIDFSNVCDFYRVSCKHKEVSLQQACERWLELFLVTELSQSIQLRDVTFDLLLKTLRCPRLFTIDEYELLRTVLYWIYLQFNPNQDTLPSHTTIINFFCRAPGVFLEQPHGRTYAPLFQTLHLYGITEGQLMEEMRIIKVLPYSWLHFNFYNIVYSIYSGGNMNITNFSKQAVRFGMTVTQDHCSRTVGLYGFYFLLKASQVGKSGEFAFSMERLRYWDPEIAESCKSTQPFSMRAERCVSYQISVQSRVCGEWQERSSGQLTQVFCLSKRYSKSQVFTVDALCVPALVTFSLAFPSE